MSPYNPIDPLKRLAKKLAWVRTLHLVSTIGVLLSFFGFLWGIHRHHTTPATNMWFYIQIGFTGVGTFCSFWINRIRKQISIWGEE